ncbi:T9SS type A sorting domain-containing protein, partial [Calditrichota bacterium]
AYPNPFNSETVIEYALPQRADVTLAIYDLNGRLVNELVSGERSAGWHKVRFDGSAFATGQYLVRLNYPGGSEVRKVVLVK